MADQLGESFRQSRRELCFQLITWTVFAIWVVGYCGFNAWDTGSETIELTLGMPSWVVWGIAVPWVAAFAITVGFAGWFMQDTDLVDDFASHTDIAQSSGSVEAVSSQDND